MTGSSDTHGDLLAVRVIFWLAGDADGGQPDPRKQRQSVRKAKPANRSLKADEGTLGSLLDRQEGVLPQLIDSPATQRVGRLNFAAVKQLEPPRGRPRR